MKVLTTTVVRVMNFWVLLDPRLLGGCHWRIRGNTPQHRLHIAFPNAQNPALPLNGRANRSEACFQQALCRLALTA
jgi:hypothetical protein